MVWLTAVVAVLFLALQDKGKKFLFTAFCLVILAGAFVPFFLYYTATEFGSERYYRGYVLLKSYEIWKDYPFLGAGPGTYGGVVSLIFKSPIYAQYYFSRHWFSTCLKEFRSLDQFWPQVMVEMGIIGGMIFVIFLFTLWRVTKDKALTERDPFKKHLLQGLSSIPIIIFIYLFGSGLNLTPFLFTYSSLLGLSLKMR